MASIYSSSAIAQNFVRQVHVEGGARETAATAAMHAACLARRSGPSAITSVLNVLNVASRKKWIVPRVLGTTDDSPSVRSGVWTQVIDGALHDRGTLPGPNECRHSSSQPAIRGIEQHVLQTVPSSRRGAQHGTDESASSGFALYRALLRQVPLIKLPDELTSRPGWINPIRFLVRNGFRRNKTDTSPRLVTSALKSGYRFLSLLRLARDASSLQHSQVVTFLRDRQNSFPPPSAPPPRPEKPERAPPLLTRTSPPGEPPVYASTFRPRPLAELSGGKRKVPVLDAKDAFAFLRIGKPQSHRHANFLRRKADRRQARVTAIQELSDDDRPAAAAEDAWEALVARVALAEGLRIDDQGEDEAAGTEKGAQGRGGTGSFRQVVKTFGIDHVSRQLDEEAADLIARSRAMLDIVDEEKRLAEQEKEDNRMRRLRAWEQRQGKQNQGED